MRFPRKDLTSALSLLSKIVERRRAHPPILECVRVEALGDQVQLTATDLEVSANLQLRNEAPESTPPFCVNLANLATIVKAQPKSVKEITLTVETDKARATELDRQLGQCAGTAEEYAAIEAARDEARVRPARATINGVTVDVLSVENFPSVTTATTKAVPMPGFLAALGMVAGAISQDENRYALNGVYLVPDKGVLVATDGHRLHIGRIPPVKKLAAGILPRKAVSVILSAGKSALETGAISENMFTTHLTNGVIVCRLIEGQFPNYEAVIPKAETLTTSVTVPSQTLREAIVTVSVVAENRNKPSVQLAANGAITLSASSQELGQAEVALAGATHAGKPVKIGLNARYLADVLGQVTSDAVTIQMKDELSAILVNDGNFSAVVMPMRI
jgi:DNA polymerase-3 subunit beta